MSSIKLNQLCLAAKCLNTVGQKRVIPVCVKPRTGITQTLAIAVVLEDKLWVLYFQTELADRGFGIKKKKKSPTWVMCKGVKKVFLLAYLKALQFTANLAKWMQQKRVLKKKIIIMEVVICHSRWLFSKAYMVALCKFFTCFRVAVESLWVVCTIVPTFRSQLLCTLFHKMPGSVKQTVCAFWLLTRRCIF